MDLQERISQFVRSLPVAHRVVIGAAVAALAMVTVLFFTWVSTPTYTVLYAGMDERDVSAVITQLDSDGVPYKLENGGRTVLVPKAKLFDTRARLAGQGIGGSVAPQGYELLDAEGLTISDFRQQVDFKRAVEGELARTLMAMDAVSSATVHLVIPEDELFVEAQDPASASVLVDTGRTLNQNEVETITFLVSSAVADLEPSHVTVADTNGNVLNAPGDSLGVAGALSKNLRLTREYEAKVAADLQRLLNTAVGVGRAEVSVKAVLDFDETETQRETYAPESQVATREQTISESFVGSGTPPGGTVGIDGGPITSSVDGETTTYNRDEVTREYGIDKTVDVTRNAPGDVEQLSLAIVLDDGSQSGLTAPDTAEIERLVTAAAGISEARGDTVAVTTAAFPVIEDTADIGGNLTSMIDMVPQILGGVALFAIALALLMMSRKGKDEDEQPLSLSIPPELLALPPGGLTAQEFLNGAGQIPAAIGRDGATVPVGQAPTTEAGPSSVAELVERQPEEIAQLLRQWLAEPEGAQP